LTNGIGILHGNRQAHPGHHRQIDQIIAHISDLFGRQAEPSQQAMNAASLSWTPK
jgi:hypothetical protein